MIFDESSMVALTKVALVTAQTISSEIENDSEWGRTQPVPEAFPRERLEK